LLGTELVLPITEPSLVAQVIERASLQARGIPVRPSGASQVLAACDVNCVVLGVPGAGPSALEFAGVLPNPITAGSRLRFTLPEDAEVRIELFDASGRRLRLVCDRVFSAGQQMLDWTDVIGGAGASTGIYLIRLETLGRRFVRRAVVLR
jgi:hypothetical protein